MGMSQVMHSNSFHPRYFWASVHFMMQIRFGNCENPFVLFRLIQHFQVILHLITQKLRHLNIINPSCHIGQLALSDKWMSAYKYPPSPALADFIVSRCIGTCLRTDCRIRHKPRRATSEIASNFISTRLSPNPSASSRAWLDAIAKYTEYKP